MIVVYHHPLAVVPVTAAGIHLGILPITRQATTQQMQQWLRQADLVPGTLQCMGRHGTLEVYALATGHAGSLLFREIEELNRIFQLPDPEQRVRFIGLPVRSCSEYLERKSRCFPLVRICLTRAYVAARYAWYTTVSAVVQLEQARLEAL